jgi:antitoxin ParD1/3/4
MAEGVNVRFNEKMRLFIESRIGDQGLYSSASEYIRDLVRRDYERQEARKWDRLMQHLRPGMEADESEFVDFDPEAIIAAAKQEKAADNS